jgi:AraC family transcriptional regulator, regulatory protein of adaptative response / DNA-3-methyladenine glycosylase II
VNGPNDPLVAELPFRAPYDGAALIGFLAARAVSGVEEVREGSYLRSVRLPRAAGVVELTPGERHVRARLWLDDRRDLGAALRRCRRMLDLDADPAAIAAQLGPDRVVGALVRMAPGRRVAGTVDGGELAIRAVLGQQISIAAAAAIGGRITFAHGEPLRNPVGTVVRLFPTPSTLAGLDPAGLPMPAARAATLVGLCGALHRRELELEGSAARAETIGRLLALPGVGPWTAGYIAMRALHDPDAFLPGDLGVRRALAALGEDASPRSAARIGEGWRPYRAYATQHLWAQGPSARLLKSGGGPADQ